MMNLPITIRPPASPNEWAAYYQLRWVILRKPWNQPKGSEKDEGEDKSVHLVAMDEGQGKLIATGRLVRREEGEAQIRSMAVHSDYQGRGIGMAMVKALEVEGRAINVSRIYLHARESALPFYHRAGYQTVRKSHLAFGEIQHYLLDKHLSANGS